MKSATVDLIKRDEKAILDQWLNVLKQSNIYNFQASDEPELYNEIKNFLKEFSEVLSPNTFDLNSGEFNPLRKMVVEIAQKNTALGFSAKESALYIFSLKNILFNLLLKEYENDAAVLVKEIKIVNKIIDELGTIIFDTFVEDREEIIKRQRQELLEASTPIINIWDGILGVPIIGTIDSVRAQQIMDTLLNSINDTGYEVAIIDISGVSTLDTITAQHILKTAAAAKLMGATCIISGISPNIAQTIINLDIDLGKTITKGSMSEAIKSALEIIGKKSKKNILEYGKNTSTEDRKSIVNFDTD